MRRALWIHSWRDSRWLLLGCCALLIGFIWLRLWIIAQIDFAEAANLFSKMLPDFFQQLLPVPIDMITTIEGRVAIGYEELPVILLMALWTVTRGSECLAGRLGDGTMEMMMAQPIRRLDVVTSHSGVTLLGTGCLAVAAWLGNVAGIATVGFDEPTSTTTYLPASFNLLALGVFMAGCATLFSALARSRAEAVALFVGFYVLEMTLKILGLLSIKLSWLKGCTFLSAYEPTRLTIGLESDPERYWSLFWLSSGTLLGLGIAALALAATIFCQRDVPAPL